MTWLKKRGRVARDPEFHRRRSANVIVGVADNNTTGNYGVSVSRAGVNSVHKAFIWTNMESHNYRVLTGIGEEYVDSIQFNIDLSPTSTLWKPKCGCPHFIANFNNNDIPNLKNMDIDGTLNDIEYIERENCRSMLWASSQEAFGSMFANFVHNDQ